MKPFERKYIVYQVNCSENPFLSWSREGENEEDCPQIFDTFIDAVKAVLSFMEDIIDAEQSGNMQEGTVESEFNNNLIAFCDLDTDDILTVYTLTEYDEQDIILQGEFSKWRDL